MCGTANNNNNNSDYEHVVQHLNRMSAADTAAYEYLTKDSKKLSSPHPHMPAVDPIELKKPSDTLTEVTAVTKKTVDKFATFFSEVQKSPAYK